MNKLRNMTGEDWKLVPLAALGLARGIGELLVYELTRHSKKPEFRPASITYYGGENEQQETVGSDRYSDTDN